MQLKPMKAGTVHLYTGGLPAADRALTGVNLIDSVEETLRQFIGHNGDHALAVIPEGPYVVPYYQPA
jgi:lactate racemase